MPLGRQQPDGVPERIGKYKVLQKIGAGAMGEVYRAVDPMIERHVAIKIFTGDLDAAPDLRKRFIREARSAGALSHRNIITIYDLVEEAEFTYIVMELLVGEDLQTRIARRVDMALEQALELMLEVSDGVAHAHQRGIVHRDIKPGNIFITNAGQVKILDFGLAHAGVSDITKTGYLMGTPNYMSPEQVRGERADERSDIFSMGAVCYELLTFKKPFDAPTLPAIFFKILSEDPEPIDRSDPRIPRELAAVVGRALAKDPASRYPKVNEFRRDLERVLRSLKASTQRVMDEVRAVELEVSRLIEQNRDLLGDEMARQQAAASAASQTLVPGRQTQDSEGSDTVSLPPSYLEALLKRESAVSERGRLEALVEHRRTIAARMAEVAKLEHEGKLEKALRLAEEVLAETPLDSAAKAVSRLREAVAERARRDERRREAERLLAQARERERRGDLPGAVETLEQALATEPGYAEAAALLKAVSARLEAQRLDEKARADQLRRRLGQAVTAARKALEKKDRVRARTEIEAALALDPHAHQARELLAEVERLDRAERERRDEIAAQLAKARAAESVGQLEEALALAGPLATEPAGAAEARQILDRAEAALKVQRQRAEVERRSQVLISEAEGLAAREDYRSAVSLLERADSALPAVKRALEQYREGARRQDEARKRAAEVAEHFNRGKMAFERDDLTLCEQEMQRVLALARDHAGAQDHLARARKRLEEKRKEQERGARARSALRSARQALAAGNLAEALADAERVLSIDPGNSEAEHLRAEAQRRLAEAREAAQQAPPTLVLGASVSPPKPVTSASSPALPSAIPADPRNLSASRSAAQIRPHRKALLYCGAAVLALGVALAVARLNPGTRREPISSPPVPAASTGATPSTLVTPSVATPQIEGRRGGETAVESPQPQATDSGVQQRVIQARERAKALLDSGKLDEATTALGEALRLEPPDAQSRRLMAEIDREARKSARSAVEALGAARSGAEQARAADLAQGAFETARQADQEGSRLLEAKQFTKATQKLGEAADAYRRAEVEARSEASRRAEAERQRALQTLPAAPPTTMDQRAILAQRQAEEVARQAERERQTARDREAVQTLLQRYRTALEGKDIGLLKALWPTLSGAQEKAIRESFQFTRSMRIGLLVQDLQISGDGATVQCQRHVEVLTVEGQRAQTDTASTFVLRRSGEAWVIETIR